VSPFLSLLYLVFLPFVKGVKERYFLVVFAAFSFLVFLGGGSPGVLWPFAVASSLLYVAGIAFWRFGYLLVAVAVAVDAVAYGAELGVLGVGGPYFGYVALLCWAAWRVGGSSWARVMGASAAVLQVVLNMSGALKLYGAWTYAPFLAASLIPIVFFNRGAAGGPRLPLLLAATALGWGLFKLVTGLPAEFREGWLYLAYLALFSLLAASLYVSPRRFVGGVLIAVGVYLAAIYFLPQKVTEFILPAAPLLLLFIVSTYQPKIWLPVVAGAVALFMFLYFSPVVYIPPLNTSAVVGPVKVLDNGTLPNAERGFVSLKAGLAGFNGTSGVVVADFVFRVVQPFEERYVFYISLERLEKAVGDKLFVVFPHVGYLKVTLLDDIYHTAYFCVWASRLSLGCEGVYASFRVELYLMGNILLFSLLWFVVLLVPYLTYYRGVISPLVKRAVTKLYIVCTSFITRYK